MPRRRSLLASGLIAAAICAAVAIFLATAAFLALAPYH